MEALLVILTFVIGIVVRFVFPLGLTALVVWVLRKLDARWQTEAEQFPSRLANAPIAPPCWEVRGCSPERRAQCPAYQQSGQPCWQVMRQATGRLPDRCLDCPVFRSMPVASPRGI